MTSPDLLIIGGGIVGCAAARDAAGRGLSVLLLESRDIGSGTTSRTSRMAHGGLRYLEHGEIGLVRESLVERNRLLRQAPDLVRSHRFFLPLGAGRSPWVVRAGLRVYDLLGGSLDSRAVAGGFTYTDALCEPERLTAAFAEQARSRGAEIRTRCPVESVARDGRVRAASGEEFRPRGILLAAGPWAERLLKGWGLGLREPLLRPTRGTHLLMSRPIDGPRLLQARSDGRVFFALPAWGGTLVGTTDLDDDSDPAAARPRESEIEYLLREVEEHIPELGDEYRGAWTGIRPLVYGRGPTAGRTRRELVFRHPDLRRMIVCVGGKLTTARLMAERAVDVIESRVFHRVPEPWTRDAAFDATTFAAANLSDHLLRRTGVAFEADAAVTTGAAREFAAAHGWNDDRLRQEWSAFRDEARIEFGLSHGALA